MQVKSYICQHCGNILFTVCDSGVVPTCCSDPMQELKAGTTDAATEKHVPVYGVDGNKVTVQVGEVEHPMMPYHYIGWICVETANGQVLFKELSPKDAPVAEFALAEGDSVKTVYAWCNQHGLWKAE